MFRYIPDFILHKYESQQLSGSFYGYVLFIDIADFTPIGTQLQKQGKDGAEELSKFMDFVFTEPIKHVVSYGGFVSLFAGDAFCAIYPEASGLGIVASVNAIREFVKTNSIYHSPVGNYALKVRQTATFGEVHWQILDNPSQCEYVFFGAPLAEIGSLSSHKEECIFSTEAVRKLGLEHFSVIDNGYFPLPLDDAIEPVSLMYVHAPETYSRFLQKRLLDDKPDNEIRSAAFCFANLEAIPRQERCDAVAKLAALTLNYGAYINKLDATDKGMSALILFGLPRSEGSTLERICSFALEAICQMPLLALGLAKGNVYAGYTGCGKNKEYTALGHPVNLAARLMSSAKPGEIVTDNYLYLDLQDKYLFKSNGSIHLKGISFSINSYLLRDQSTEIKYSMSSFVGRSIELNELKHSIDEALRNCRNLAMYVYGDAGIGKSRLLRELMMCYPDSKYHKFYPYCDAILKKPLEPIKQIIRQYFVLDQTTSPTERIAAFRERWELLADDDPEHIRIESIIASLLGYEWEKSVWSVLPPDDRPAQLKNAFVRFIARLAAQKPILIYLDDGQWIDKQSKECLQALSDAGISSLQIVSSCRYLDDGTKPDLGLAKHETAQTDLGILDQEECKELMKAILNLPTLPDDSHKKIYSRAMGNPFFIEQLCVCLQENGKMDANGTITEELGAVNTFSISDIIGSRIDRLTDNVRECVYNAAVLGMEFNVQVLSRMLNNSLNMELTYGKINRIWDELDELRYIFSHILIKDTVYQRMMSAKLKELHKLAAEAIETVCQDSLDERAEEIAYHFDQAGMEVEAAKYYNQAGLWFKDHYDWVTSEALLKIALSIREEVLGAEHPDTATSLNNLAFFYDAQGEYKQAESLHLRALEIREKVFGADHPNTATSLNNLASLYENQGKFEKSEPYLLRALKTREKVLGPEHPDTAGSLNNLASLYMSQGKHEQCEHYLLRSLGIFEKILGTEHPNTATLLNNLANLYVSQGKYELAEPLHLRALEIKEKALGAEHPQTGNSLNNLANLYQSQGRYKQAEPLYLQALEIRKKVLGAKHPYTARSLHDLAYMYQIQGNIEQAVPLYLRVLEIRENVLGAEHPETVATLNNLAGLYWFQGKYEQAEPLYLQVLEIAKNVLGEEHPETAAILNNLADLYRDQGKYELAESLHLRALEIREDILGAEHPDTATSLNNLASLYSFQGRFNQAAPMYLRALEIREKVLGVEHPYTGRVMFNLGTLYKSMGGHSQAEPLLIRACDVVRKTMGDNHPWSIEAIKGLAELYEQMKLPDKTAQYQAMLIQIIATV